VCKGEGIPCLWMPSDRQFSMLADPAVVGDRLSQLYRNMRSNIDMEVRRIGRARGLKDFRRRVDEIGTRDRTHNSADGTLFCRVRRRLRR
jgi:hypothetical protein